MYILHHIFFFITELSKAELAKVNKQGWVISNVLKINRTSQK